MLLPESQPQALPPSPKLIIGHSSVIESVVQVVLSSPEPRIVILGQGGMGKTTVASAVLHDPGVISVYRIRYFISCELAPTVELLENLIADALSIPQANRGSNLTSVIVNNIHSGNCSVLLFIDNLETVWEVETEQTKVDRFLEMISTADSKLAILVTMRGAQEPKTSFPWDSTVLSGLNACDATTMYEAFSKRSADASAQELLSKLGGTPLAIKLFAMLVKEGDKPSQLLSSWNIHGTGTLEIGGKHKLSSLEQSIHLSVFSPRIDDNTRLVLSLIAHMPDGLSTSAPWFEGFEFILPDKLVLQPILRSLRRAALLEESEEPSRWQMLPPIRQFCLRLLDPNSPTLVSLVDLYVNEVTRHYDYTSSTSQTIILPEMANIRGFLLHGSNLRPLPTSIGQAGAAYAGWASWQAIDESAFLAVFLDLQLPMRERAYIYWRQGMLHQRWHRLDAADSSFAHALKLYTESSDQWGKVNTLKAIGDLELRRDQLDASSASLTRVLELYVEVGSRWGQANTHKSIGYIHLCRDQLDAAEASFSCAMELYVEDQERLGQANTHSSIGSLHMRRDQLDMAEVSFIRAQELYAEVRNRLGVAKIGKLRGNVCLRRNELDAAQELFTRALQQYTEVQNQGGMADCFLLLGRLWLCKREPEEAYEALSQALTIWEEIGDDRSIAETQQAFGDLHLQKAQLDDAESYLNLALNIYSTKVTSRRDEALTYRSIGELHLLRSHFEESERAFRRALELDIAASSRLGQGMSYRGLGGMFLKKGDVTAAESSCTNALRLFNEIEDYQATQCLLELGKVWFVQGKIDESEALDYKLLRHRWDASEQVSSSKDKDPSAVS